MLTHIEFASSFHRKTTYIQAKANVGQSGLVLVSRPNTGWDTLTPLPFVEALTLPDTYPQKLVITYGEIWDLHKLKIFTKYEADLLCQNMSHVTTKGRGVRVSHPLQRKSVYAPETRGHKL